MAYQVVPQQFARPIGDDIVSDCPSCFSGHLTAFLVGGLISAVVILAVAPALRLHKEYRTHD